jgi:predicted nucleotidyltransferase
MRWDLTWTRGRGQVQIVVLVHHWVERQSIEIGEMWEEERMAERWAIARWKVVH